MELKIITEIKDELDALGSEIVKDCGAFGSALVASIKYDIQKAFGVAVEVGKEELGNFWITAKAQIAAEASNLLKTFETDGYHAAAKSAKDMLKNIDWKAVGGSLAGIGETTLEAAAGVFVRMLIAGVIAAI